MLQEIGVTLESGLLFSALETFWLILMAWRLIGRRPSARRRLGSLR